MVAIVINSRHTHESTWGMNKLWNYHVISHLLAWAKAAYPLRGSLININVLHSSLEMQSKKKNAYNVNAILIRISRIKNVEEQLQI